MEVITDAAMLGTFPPPDDESRQERLGCRGISGQAKTTPRDTAPARGLFRRLSWLGIKTRHDQRVPAKYAQ
jgi:hypothetical protein